MTQMEASVHVCVRKRAEPLGERFLKRFHTLVRLKKLGICRDTFRERGCISVEIMAILPGGLYSPFDIGQIVSFIGL